METIHTRIKKARLEKKLSMEQMAELLGLKSWQTIQQWENGGTAPARKRLQSVAKLLGKTSEFLLNGTEQKGIVADSTDVLIDALKHQEVISAAWPFKRMPQERYMQLTDSQKEALEDSMVRIVDALLLEAPTEDRKKISNGT